jgi:hypothetical protein
MPKKIEVLAREVRLTGVNDQDYVCLTDIARCKETIHTDDLIRNWLLWEQINNPGFNPVEFDGIRMQAGVNSFTDAAFTHAKGALGLGHFNRPKGALHASPGQRPGDKCPTKFKALKGRPNRCRNPSPASTSTSFSARSIVNPSSPIPSAMPCMPTWLQSCKISAVPRSSSTLWRTTPICSSTWPEPFLSAKPSKTLKILFQMDQNPRSGICRICVASRIRGFRRF